MLEAVEKLLILQERDRRLLRLRAEVADVAPQRRLVENLRDSTEKQYEEARLQGFRLESERKKLELEVESKKELIAKYSAQQWQTRKNEEYKALAHEINTCKAAIQVLDDQQLALMEQIEASERRATHASDALRKSRADSEQQLKQLNEAEVRLAKQLAEAEEARLAFAATLDPGLLTRYDRILKSKGGKAVAGVDRGVCDGCHMKLSRQDILDTRSDRDIVTCPNCGRILYYTRDMDVKHAE